MRWRLIWIYFAAILQTPFGSLLRRGRQIFTSPTQFDVTVLRQFPHEGKPFTQGLEFMENGMLVETSGAFPSGATSYIRTIDPSSGATLAKIETNLDTVFAEGIARLPGGHWAVSTWLDRKVLEYDQHLNFVKEHPYSMEGWGLARNAGSDTMLATNGSEWLVTLKPSKDGFLIVKEDAITCDGKKVPRMNELEMVQDFLGYGPTLLGNIYETRDVLAVDPTSGKCIGSFSLDGIDVEEADEHIGNHVANGIAYNRQTGTYILTGKNWANMYEVRIEKTVGNEKAE